MAVTDRLPVAVQQNRGSLQPHARHDWHNEKRAEMSAIQLPANSWDILTNEADQGPEIPSDPTERGQIVTNWWRQALTNKEQAGIFEEDIDNRAGKEALAVIAIQEAFEERATSIHPEENLNRFLELLEEKVNTGEDFSLITDYKPEDLLEELAQTAGLDTSSILKWPSKIIMHVRQHKITVQEGYDHAKPLWKRAPQHQEN